MTPKQAKNKRIWVNWTSSDLKRKHTLNRIKRQSAEWRKYFQITLVTDSSAQNV
jgi:hypothetical protein